jgi:cytochrome c
MPPSAMAARGTRRTDISIARDGPRGGGELQFGLGLTVALLVFVSACPAWAQEGERVFQRCYACHSLDTAERNLAGPTLRGVFGRRAGTLDGFDYSQPLKKAGRDGLVWSTEMLDRFLEDPEAVVQGVRMGGVRLRNAAERRALIRWLERVTE